MKKIVFNGINYLYITVLNIVCYFGVFSWLLCIGTILLYQEEAMMLADSNWQQTWLFFINNSALALCLVSGCIDSFLKKSFLHRNLFIDFLYYIFFHQVIRWYGNTNQMPFSSLCVERVLKWAILIILLKFILEGIKKAKEKCNSLDIKNEQEVDKI